MSRKSPLERIQIQSLKLLYQPISYLIRAKLWLQILFAMVLGIICGSLLSSDFNYVTPSTAKMIGEWVALPGNVFLALIQMIVVPLILSSIIRGMASSSDIQQLKTTGLSLFAYYITTTVVAILIGVSAGLIFQPGKTIDVSRLQSAPQKVEKQSNAQLNENKISIPKRITEVLPSNPLGAMVEGDMLQIVIFAIIFGIGLVQLPVQSSKPLLDLFGSMQEVSMVIVGTAMSFAPFAVFGLLTRSLIQTGPQVLYGMGFYTLILIGSMTCLYFFYLIVAIVVGGKNPGEFIKASIKPLMFGFSTNSSAATMPVTVKAAEEDLKVRPSLASFIVPLGATINMDGTACYQGLTTLFIAQAYGMDLSVSVLLSLIVTAVGASIGTPAVPGVGIIVLSGVLASVGVPLAGLSLIIGLDRILERFRTALNVTGDLTACVVMDRLMPSKITKDEDFCKSSAIEKNDQIPFREIQIN